MTNIRIAPKIIVFILFILLKLVAMLKDEHKNENVIVKGFIENLIRSTLSDFSIIKIKNGMV